MAFRGVIARKWTSTLQFAECGWKKSVERGVAEEATLAMVAVGIVAVQGQKVRNQNTRHHNAGEADSRFLRGKAERQWI